MARKNKADEHPAYIIQWSSLSGDGWRVKHRVLRDNELPDCFWHIEIRLTDNPVALYEGGYEEYPRKFFGKVWIAQKIEYKRARTWEAIGEAVRQLKLKEKGIIWNKYIDADRLIEYLEKEADKEFKKTEENANSPVLCHFHNGCRMQALDTIDFIKELQQEQSCDTCTNDKGCVTCKDGELWEGKEQPCEGLEDAAEKYRSDLHKMGDDIDEEGCMYRNVPRDAFIAGAEWQKYQMLKDAVEGKVVELGETYKDLTLSAEAKELNGVL